MDGEKMSTVNPKNKTDYKKCNAGRTSNQEKSRANTPLNVDYS